MSSGKSYRLAVVTSHPIQYQAPLFQALAASGVEITVLFCSRWGSECYFDREFGVRLNWDVPLLDGYSYEFVRNVSFSDAPRRFWSLVNPGLVKRITCGGFDAILIHGWSYMSCWLAWCASAVSRVPVLLRGESNGLCEPTGVKALVKQIVLRVYFSRIAAFLSIGTLNSRFYESYGIDKERIFFTPYAVDNERFLSQSDALLPRKHALREVNGIAPDLPVILYCGKLIPRKEPMDVLRAFARLPKHRKASLVFVGDGALRPALEAQALSLALDRVHFLGFRNQQQIPSCYAMADVLVLPSRSETWGLVINEAMCFGLSIVCTKQVGAAPDLVLEGLNGFTYECGDIAALVSIFDRLVSDPEMREKMGLASARRIRSWDNKATVKGIMNALLNIAKRR